VSWAEFRLFSTDGGQWAAESLFLSLNHHLPMCVTSTGYESIVSLGQSNQHYTRCRRVVPNPLEASVLAYTGHSTVVVSAGNEDGQTLGAGGAVVKGAQKAQAPLPPRTPAPRSP